MACPTLLGLPVELRYQISEYLRPSCENITISTVIVDLKNYAKAMKLVAKIGGLDWLPEQKFLEADPILASASTPSHSANTAPPTSYQLTAVSLSVRALTTRCSTSLT